jgi:hypothetical protein
MTTVDSVVFELALDGISNDVITDSRDELRVAPELSDRHRSCGGRAAADDRKPCGAMLFGALRQLRGAEDEVLHRVADAQRPLHVKVTS